MSDLYDGQVFGTGWRPLTRDDSLTSSHSAEKMLPKASAVKTEQVQEKKDETALKFASKEDCQKLNEKLDALVSGVTAFNGNLEKIISDKVIFNEMFEALVAEISCVNESFGDLMTNMEAINEKLDTIIKCCEDLGKPRGIEEQEHRGIFKIFGKR